MSESTVGEIVGGWACAPLNARMAASVSAAATAVARERQEDADVGGGADMTRNERGIFSSPNKKEQEQQMPPFWGYLYGTDYQAV